MNIILTQRPKQRKQNIVAMVRTSSRLDQLIRQQLQNVNFKTRTKSIKEQKNKYIFNFNQQLFKFKSNTINTQRVAQQIIKQKLIVSQYSEAIQDEKKFINKLISSKKCPYKSIRKHKQANANKIKSYRQNKTIQTFGKLESSEYDLFFTNQTNTQYQKQKIQHADIQKTTQCSSPNIKPKSIRNKCISQTYLHNKPSNKNLQINRKKTIFLMKISDKGPNKSKNNTNSQFEYKITCNFDKSRQYIERNQIVQNASDYTLLPPKRQSIPKHRGSIIQKQDKIKSNQHKQNQKKQSVKIIGNYKSACDEFRIKKRNSVSHQRKNSETKEKALEKQQNQNNKQIINGWAVWVDQNNLQRQNGLKRPFSSLRLEQENIQEQQFIQFALKSKQNTNHQLKIKHC